MTASNKGKIIVLFIISRKKKRVSVKEKGLEENGVNENTHKMLGLNYTDYIFFNEGIAMIIMSDYFLVSN